MKNPFRYGETVIGECFADRQKEISEIKVAIKSAQNLFIYSYRRLGKTSLIKTVLKSLADDRSIIPVYVDLQRAPSVGQFVETYSGAISQSFITGKEKLQKVSALFKRIIPSFETTETGGWKVSFEFSKTSKGIEKALEEVYELPQKIADKYKKRVVVIFDEFQEISQYNGSAFEKKLRSFIQHHNEVCYIFIGSKTHLILEMFQNPQRAFYHSAKIYPLPLIPEKELVNFISHRFKSTHKHIPIKLAHEIVKLARQSPYHIQMLSSSIWILGGNKIKEKDIQSGLDEIMRTQNELFYSWYDSRSMHQRAVLNALSQTGEMFSRDTRLTYNLGSSSTVQASIKALVRFNLVISENKKYRIFDPFFEMWLRRNVAA